LSTIVADASILIHLSRIGRFHLLKDVYNQITITSSVFMEVLERGWGLAGSLETERAMREGWIKVLDVKILPADNCNKISPRILLP